MDERSPLRLAYSGDPAVRPKEGVTPAFELSAGADEIRGTGRRTGRTARACPEGETPAVRFDGVELSAGWDREGA